MKRNFIQKRNFILQIVSVILESHCPRAFSFITWGTNFSKTFGFCRVIKTTIFNHANPKQHINKTIFCQLQKALLSGFFPIKKHFFCITFLSWKIQKMYMKFHKSSTICFWQWFWLIDWMADCSAFTRPFCA